MGLDMKKLGLFVIAVTLGQAGSGCATKEYVHEYVQGQLKPVQDRLGALEQRADRMDGGQRRMDTQLGALGGRLDQAEATLKAHDARIAAVSKTAQEALERAVAAGKLAEGKLLYEVVMTQDTLRFATEQATLSEAAKAALDEFAARIKAEGKPVFIEIQGHTDSRGPAAYNERLGLMRAEAVRQYLHRKGGLPLARMSVISYGHTEPVADNRTREGRQQNRRVVLVVLQ
jgi:outer membrane protein OmpA-like peptidoglycan-associated protein